jgi:hypothetical protein
MGDMQKTTRRRAKRDQIPRWVRAAAGVLPLFLFGCLVEVGGLEEEEEVELERSMAVAFNSQAICKVKVSGYGTVDVETEYVPRVVWCEMGNMRQEALKAQAIAARTFMYRLIAIRKYKTMKNGTSDQVYKASRCSGTIPQSFLAAAAATAGQVMVQPGGHLHHGYYRGVTYKSCAKRPNCYGQPCMSQHGANACASKGHSSTQILNLFYNNPRIARAWGSCTQSGGGDVNTDCFYGGRRGTCQSVSQPCNGTYIGSQCPGSSDIKCCMPPDTNGGGGDGGGGGDWGGCSSGGKQGTCQSTSTQCNGYHKSGLCPGPNAIKCCLPGSAWGSCSSGGKQGTCQSTSTQCGGSFKSGLCPGPGNIQCCLP